MNLVSDFFSSAWAYALGWTLLHSLWQGTLIALAIALLMIFLRKASGRLRYLVYGMGLLLVLGTSVVTFVKHFDVNRVLPVHASYDNTNAPVAPLVVITDALLSNTGNTSLVDLWNWSTGYFSRNLPFFTAIWFLGMVLFLLKFLGGLAYTQRLKHYRVRKPDGNWLQRFDGIASGMGLTCGVEFLESFMVKVPVVIHILKPVVIIPAGMLTQMPVSQIDAIISHELAHIYRKDYLMNLLQSIIEIVFFFHPAVWWLSRNIRSERENICDDIALSYCNNSLEYAKALAAAQELQLNKGVMAPAFSNRKNLLLNRIQRMMKKQRLMNHYAEGFISALVVMISIAAISASAAISFNPLNDSKILTVFDNEIEPVRFDTLKNGDTIFSVFVNGIELDKDIFDNTDAIETGGGIIVIHVDKEKDLLRWEGLSDSLIKSYFLLKDELKDVEATKEEIIIKIKKKNDESGRNIEDIEEAWVETDSVVFIKLRDEMRDIDRKIIKNVKTYPDSNWYKYHIYTHMPDSFTWISSDSEWFNQIGFSDSLKFFSKDFEFRFPDEAGHFFGVDSGKNGATWVYVSPDQAMQYIEKEKEGQYRYFHEQQELLAEEMEEKAKQMELEYQQQYQKAFQQYINTPQYDSKTDRIVKKELIRDALIGETEKDVILELTNKQMFINGEKQSKSAYKKYRKLVESTINMNLGNEFHYKLIL